MRTPLAATWHIHALFILSTVFLLACASSPEPVKVQHVPLPQSTWNGQYRYAYDKPLPSQPAASIPVTISVCNPDYKVEESALLREAYKLVGKGWSASMGVDFDKVLIAKGMTTKGPFPGLDEITYADKKGSDLALTPKVFINTEVKYIGGRSLEGGATSQPGQKIYMGEYEPGKHWGMKEYEVTVTGWFVFVLQEPLSTEKMWIKRLELEEYKERGMECYEAEPSGYMQKNVFYQTGWSVSDRLIMDQKADSVANALKKYYPSIIDKLQTYIDINELTEMKEKVAEIRRLKRY
jgi:hypothetical protein